MNKTPFCFLYETIVLNFQCKSLVILKPENNLQVPLLPVFLEEESRENSLFYRQVSASLAHKLLAWEIWEEHSGLGLASSKHVRSQQPGSSAVSAKATKQHLVFEAKNPGEETILCE